MTERSLGQNASAFHDDAVIDLGALFNHNVAEQDGVLYLALDAAAVGDEAVLYVGFIAVIGRSFVLDAVRIGRVRLNTSLRTSLSSMSMLER